MPMFDLVCTNGHELLDIYLKVGERPPCPTCGTPTETLWRPGSQPSVIADDIPGGYLVKHGICNEDGSPRRYYSKSEMAAEAKRRGLTNLVEHKTAGSSDKSKHTSRWV